MKMTDKILVTKATGTVGKALVKALLIQHEHLLGQYVTPKLQGKNLVQPLT